MRYSVVIIPVNYNLLSVNAAMAVTGSYQLWRKVRAEYFPQHAVGELQAQH